MTEQKKLRELQNDIKIVGTLKEVNLEIGPNKKDPTKIQIIGDIVVNQVDKVNNRINEHVIKLFAYKSGKLFKGYETVLNEFNAAQAAGIETRVSVTGSISENMYMNTTDNTLKQFNQLRGLFINRIDEKMLLQDPSLHEDSAVAQLEILVNGVRPVTDGDGIETGEYKVSAYTVGYKESVHNVHDIIVGEDLADVITEHYEPGATGKLTFAINNFVELEEAEEQEFVPEDGGFGVQVDISAGPIKRYTRELRVIGGFPAYFDDKAYDEDEIKFIKQIYDLRVQETKNAVPSTPPTQQGGGFGVAAPQQGFNADPFANPGMIPTISDDDLPF